MVTVFYPKQLILILLCLLKFINVATCSHELSHSQVIAKISPDTLYNDHSKNIKQKINDLESQINKLKQEAIVQTEKMQEKKQIEQVFKLYKKAYNYLVQQQLEWSENIFNQIVNNNPQTEIAIFAYFWLGEIAFYRRDYVNASILYGKAYNQYKEIFIDKSITPVQLMLEQEYDRIPEIIIKLAFSLQMLGKQKESCLVLEKIMQKHSNLTNILEWLLQKLKVKLQCPN